MTVVNKTTNKTYEVYDITYDKNGYPHFLIYDDNCWKRISAKYFKEYSTEETSAQNESDSQIAFDGFGVHTLLLWVMVGEMKEYKVNFKSDYSKDDNVVLKEIKPKKYNFSWSNNTHLVCINKKEIKHTYWVYSIYSFFTALFCKENSVKYRICDALYKGKISKEFESIQCRLDMIDTYIGNAHADEQIVNAVRRNISAIEDAMERVTTAEKENI